MEPYSILMFCFAGALWLYALDVYCSRNPKLIARYYAAEMKDKKAYARQFGKVMFLVGFAPALSGLVALLVDMEKAAWIAVLTLFSGFIAAIIIGVRLMKKVM